MPIEKIQGFERTVVTAKKPEVELSFGGSTIISSLIPEIETRFRIFNNSTIPTANFVPLASTYAYLNANTSVPEEDPSNNLTNSYSINIVKSYAEDYDQIEDTPIEYGGFDITSKLANERVVFPIEFDFDDVTFHEDRAYNEIIFNVNNPDLFLYRWQGLTNSQNLNRVFERMMILSGEDNPIGPLLTLPASAPFVVGPTNPVNDQGNAEVLNENYSLIERTNSATPYNVGLFDDLQLQSTIDAIFLNYTPSIEKVYKDSEPTPNELLYFKIKKWISSDLSRPLQVFFVPALEIVKFKDFSIDRDETYTYTVTAHYHHVAFEYEFISHTVIDPTKSEVVMRQKPINVFFINTSFCKKPL